jgi:hypothetical protein
MNQELSKKRKKLASSMKKLSVIDDIILPLHDRCSESDKVTVFVIDEWDNFRDGILQTLENSPALKYDKGALVAKLGAIIEEVLSGV